VLLMQREEGPFAGAWALPGGFVGIDETIEEAAHRVLGDKAGLEGLYIEQLYTFGAIDRDPRMRIVSVAHLALLPAKRLLAAQCPGMVIVARLEFEASGSISAFARDGSALPLAFDHAEMFGLALERLRGKLDWSDVAFELLPEQFTLLQLLAVHEAILGARLNKPAFRRRLLDSGRLEPTGERVPGTSHRPPELFRRTPPKDRPWP